MFAKLLIANRGEIACRIMRTARRLGIATVAVYSEADRTALHVETADEAYPIGPAPARASYLDIPAIIAAARASGAQAVHPGYGFLSENADFAEACERAGLAFVGPPAAAIRKMGSKAAAKALMEAAGVPVVPGWHGDDQDPDRLAEEARQIGFPLLIKASAGGGGRGMRIVEGPQEFGSALASARREAAGAFGDDRVLLEKYLKRPRHIELQIFADRLGNVVHLFDRDCSIQRRYQKVVEEAPAPDVGENMRAAMAKAAVAAADAVGYVGAGTIEFIVEHDRFYFMEMNTRLQVEHAVTERVTGLDLVEWQLRVAAGQALPLGQQQLQARGHAIEVRLYAEDPEREFLPQTGTLYRLVLPPPELARVDTGVREGDRVTPYYDPMIAKIIVWGEDRAAAVGRLRRALDETAVMGLRTNLGFLAWVAADPDFAAARLDTGFIARHCESLLAPPGPAPDDAVLAAAVSRLLVRRAAAAAQTARAADPFSPWVAGDGWRLEGTAEEDIGLREGAEERIVAAFAEERGWRLRLAGRDTAAAGERLADGSLALTLDGVRRRVLALDHDRETAVFATGASWRFEEIDLLAPPAGGADPAAGKLTAPMPGRVIGVLVAAGDAVRRGAPLIVIEAMKMEHTIAAPADGVVTAVRFAAGELVEEGAELIALAPAAAGGGRAQA